MKQLFQSGGKGVILGLGPLFGAFHPSAGGPEFPGIVPDKEKGVNVVQGVFPSILVQYPGTAGKAHGGQAIILGDNDIAGGDPVDQGIIHTVCAFVKDKGLGALAVKFVGGIAEQKTGELVSGTEPDGDIHHRTAVGIDQNFQRNHLFENQYNIFWFA